MALANETTQAKTFCINHPQTETLLRCNKCGRPVCIKCVQRTPVGYRCNECLGVQRAGYYTATTLDYIVAAVVALILGAAAGFGISLISFWLIAIFVGPVAGGVISEAIRRVISKRRGRYLALVACAALVVGALSVLFFPALPFLLRGQFQILGRVVLNIGFWIFLALAVSTVYARLRV
jgi:hypothetical protein